MWSGSPALERRKTHEEIPRHPLHNVEEESQEAEESPESGSTKVPSPHNVDRGSGTWGERDVGGPLNQTMAMDDYEALRRELTTLSKSRSNSSMQRNRSKSFVRGEGGALSQQATKNSFRRVLSRSQTRGTNVRSEDEETEIGEGEGHDEEDFPLGEFMREGRFEKRIEGRSAKKVGVVFKHLTVKGVGSTATFVKTLPDAILGTFGPDLYRLTSRFIPFLHFRGQGTLRTLVHDFTGLVRDGEMMLVLGRPGAGCSTFLKALANNRESFAEVSGDVKYGGIPAEKQRKMYRGEVNYNPEDDVHMPDLNVWQTFKFALMNKTKKRDKKDIPVVVSAGGR